MPFNISCGRCWMCSRGLYAQCETTQVRDQGKGAALFGYTSLYGSVPGGQARVPAGTAGPLRADQGARTRDRTTRFLYLSDILPTAWQAVAYADVPDGGTLAVFGLGPVGQFAARIGKHSGPSGSSGSTCVPERRDAGRAGTASRSSTPGASDDVADTLIEMTGGRGPDAVIDAVGMEAHGSPARAGAPRTVAGSAAGRAGRGR